MSDWFGGKDIANWMALTISFLAAIASSLATKWWVRRWQHCVPGLDVVREKSNGRIDDAPAPSLKFRFLNNTGTLIFIQHPRLLSVTKRLPLHPGTWMDSATGSCELKFLNPSTKVFERRHTIIETHAEAETAICAAGELDLKVLHYTSPSWRRFFRRPKFFILEYVVIVDGKVVRVRTTC
jgi:hypothetical protein